MFIGQDNETYDDNDVEVKASGQLETLTIVLMFWHIGLWIAIDKDLKVIIHRRSRATGTLGYPIADSSDLGRQQNEEHDMAKHLFSILAIRTGSRLNGD